ncbi:hypothetical protein HC229_04375 [Flavobacterium sp. D33]|nr:hypothetical protein [Flavobacterium selenitireducens]
MMDDLESATESYYKGRSYVSQDWKKATVDNNLAYANILKGNYRKANLLLSEAFRQYSLPDTLEIKTKLLDNFGFSVFKLGNPDGQAYVMDALRLRKASADTSGLIASYLHLAEMVSDREEAVNFALDAERLAKLYNAPEDRLQALRILVNQSSSENIELFSKNFIRISDSLESKRLKTRTAFAKIKYDVRRLEEEKMLAKMERIRERNEKLLFINISFVLAFASAAIVYFLVRRSRNIRKKATYEAEVRISTKLHDELANEVHKTIVFTETKNLSDEANKETLLQRLENIYEGTRSISRDNSEVPEGDFGQALRELLQEYNSDECAVIAQGIANVDWEKLERRRQLEFYRIVQELLANMRKHSQCSHALFLFAIDGRNILLTYSDNGSGSAKIGQARKNGLRIMENRISGLKGSATFESMPGNGFRAYVQFPL